MGLSRIVGRMVRNLWRHYLHGYMHAPLYSGDHTILSPGPYLNLSTCCFFCGWYSVVLERQPTMSLSKLKTVYFQIYSPDHGGLFQGVQTAKWSLCTSFLQLLLQTFISLILLHEMILNKTSCTCFKVKEINWYHRKVYCGNYRLQHYCSLCFKHGQTYVT